MSDASVIKQLFATDALDEIVWSSNVDDFANGAGFVDVVVSSQAPALLRSIHKIGLAYWPNGPVLRGVQNYQQGTSVTFERVLVKPGQTLALMASTEFFESLPVRVDVTPAGGGATVEDRRRGQNGSGTNPLAGISDALGAVLGAVIVIGLIYLAASKKG